MFSGSVRRVWMGKKIMVKPYQGHFNRLVRRVEVAGDGISVNAVAANYIQTETYYPKALLEDPVKGPKLLARVPMGRLGAAEEVAAVVELLGTTHSAIRPEPIASVFLSQGMWPVATAWAR